MAADALAGARMRCAAASSFATDGGCLVARLSLYYAWCWCRLFGSAGFRSPLHRSPKIGLSRPVAKASLAGSVCLARCAGCVRPAPPSSRVASAASRRVRRNRLFGRAVGACRCSHIASRAQSLSQCASPPPPLGAGGAIVSSAAPLARAAALTSPLVHRAYRSMRRRRRLSARAAQFVSSAAPLARAAALTSPLVHRAHRSMRRRRLSARAAQFVSSAAPLARAAALTSPPVHRAYRSMRRSRLPARASQSPRRPRLRRVPLL